ncbi:MAG: winged helix-turn-helix domain-containing protein [Oscillospiraceae bacterium]|nr:winged helix-turn-helix domain-containing protein [Oscillospiraceae bacterium]
MKGREIVKRIMENKGVTNAVLSKRLGLTQAALWDRLNTKKAKDIPLSTLVEMLEQLDYKVQIVPGDTAIPEDGYEVERIE